MAYPTLAELKERLGIADGGQDALLGVVLAASIGAVEGYCGYIWESSDSETRTFEQASYVAYRSSFNVSDPGLLSASALTAISGDTRQLLDSSNYVLKRWAPTGLGPFDVVWVDGGWLRLEITGVWGQALEAPAEVSEAVMIAAMNIYQVSLSGGFIDETPVNAADWDGALIGFLLKGHRRYR